MQHSVIEQNGTIFEIKDKKVYVNGVQIGDGNYGYSAKKLIFYTCFGFISGALFMHLLTNL